MIAEFREGRLTEFARFCDLGYCLGGSRMPSAVCSRPAAKGNVRFFLVRFPRKGWLPVVFNRFQRAAFGLGQAEPTPFSASPTRARARRRPVRSEVPRRQFILQSPAEQRSADENTAGQRQGNRLTAPTQPRGHGRNHRGQLAGRFSDDLARRGVARSGHVKDRFGQLGDPLPVAGQRIYGGNQGLGPVEMEVAEDRVEKLRRRLHGRRLPGPPPADRPRPGRSRCPRRRRGNPSRRPGRCGRPRPGRRPASPCPKSRQFPSRRAFPRPARARHRGLPGSAWPARSLRPRPTRRGGSPRGPSLPQPARRRLRFDAECRPPQRPP